MNRTKIEWVKNPDGSPGYSWNPITGCLNGCEYCYARRLANTRLKERYLLNPKVADIDRQLSNSQSPLWDRVVSDPFYPRFWPEKVSEMKPLFHRKEKGIFVCDMSDLFGIGIPDDWTSQVLFAIKVNPWHRFYLLTKQPQNLAKFSPFPDNCWVGVTATNREMFEKACLYLEDIKAKVKYISFEPLLNWLLTGRDIPELKDAGINWVIIGAQTKPTVMPKIEWVEEIAEACTKAHIPLFLKNSLKPLIEPIGMLKGQWAAREWVMCKYPVLRQEVPR